MSEADTWIFGFGSLIWGTGNVEPAEVVSGYLEAWHREWSWISENRRHGAPTCSLEPGGKVNGVFIRLNPATAAEDLRELRSRERPETEQHLADIPRPGATTHFWTMDSNLSRYEELRGLSGEELSKALAARARQTTDAGPDGITAVDYIRRVHDFDPEDEETSRLRSYL